MWPDLITFSTLLTLAAYHLMIYLGCRRDLNEKYNLCFAEFVFSVILFITAPYFQPGCFLNVLRPHWLYVINIEMGTIWLMFFSGTRLLNHLFGVPSGLKKNLRYTYISFSVCILLTLTSNLISPEFYFKYVLVWVLIIVAVNVFLINFLYGLWIYRERLYKDRFIRTISTGFLLLNLNILIYRSVECIRFPEVLILNHYLTAAILYVFTYAISLKFNKQHYELTDLKSNLQIRIKERTGHYEAGCRPLEQNHNRPVIAVPYGQKNLAGMDEQFILKAVQIIEKNINEANFDSNKFSEEIGISRAHLYRKLKTLTNQSATEFIRSIRLRHAAELLNQRTATVSEIAYNTGFNNLSYFTSCFKKEFGVVPSEYFSRSDKQTMTP